MPTLHFTTIGHDYRCVRRQDRSEPQTAHCICYRYVPSNLMSCSYWCAKKPGGLSDLLPCELTTPGALQVQHTHVTCFNGCTLHDCWHPSCGFYSIQHPVFDKIRIIFNCFGCRLLSLSIKSSCPSCTVFRATDRQDSAAYLFQFNSIQFYLYSAKLQQLSSQGT